MRLRVILILFLAYIALIVFLFIKFSPSEKPDTTADLIPADSLMFTLNPADTLLTAFNRAFDSGDYDKARGIARTLNEKYPGSTQAESANARLASLDTKGTEQPPVARKGGGVSSKPKVPPKAPSKPVVASTPTSTEEQPSIAELNEKILENEQMLQSALSKMRKKYDGSQGITWYFNKDVSHYVYKNSFETYIGKSDQGEVWLRLRIYFNGPERLNINSYDVYADDKEYTISTLYGTMERGKGPGGAWEWYDMQVSPKEMTVIKEVMKARRTAIRYIGETEIWERALTEGEKMRLIDIMEAYKFLTIQKELLAAAPK